MNELRRPDGEGPSQAGLPFDAAEWLRRTWNERPQVVWAGGGVLVVVLWIVFVGFLALLKLLAVVAAAVLGLVAFGCGANALDDAGAKDEREGQWILAGVCGLLAVGLLWLAWSPKSVLAGRSPQLEATTRYWSEVPRCWATTSQELATNAKTVQWLRRSAGRIEALPTQDVDPLAVDWALRSAAAFRRAAAQYERHDAEDVGLFFRSFVRGYDGDFVGIVADTGTVASQRQASIQATADDLGSVVERGRAEVRAKLTAKYGVQFP